MFIKLLDSGIWELRFWDDITNRMGRIRSVSGFKCQGCNKNIEGDVYKESYSLDWYHPKCYIRKPNTVLIVDELNNIY